MSWNIILLMFGALGLPENPHEVEITESWIAGNSSSDLITDGNSFSCDDFCYALWEDCVSSGEHFWRVYFETEVWLQAVEMANEEKFVDEFSFGDDYHQKIEAGSTVEILASFSDGKLKGYFGYNNQSLRQVLEMETTDLSKVCPAIRYYGSGHAKIERETEMPLQSDRKDLLDIVEMEGKWLVFPENVKIGEVEASKNNFNTNFLRRNSRSSPATLTIEKVSNTTVGRYTIGLRVVNSMGMSVRMYEDTWKTATTPFQTLIGGPPELMKLESQLSKLLQNPDSVELVTGNLVLQKGNVTVTFVR